MGSISDVLPYHSLSIYFGQSAETSDFVADCLELWWQENQAIYPGFVSRVLSKNSDDFWLDIVYWKSMDEAKSAGQFWRRVCN